ncbi:MAG TPA: glycosyltransferase [Parachlamydiaceae bacterium]|nr:glycosyltransferase [Parachlamydiaceae bacterium]
MSDCFHEFLDLFEKAGLTIALSKIVSKPDICYDSLTSNELQFPLLVNYVDAVLFGIVDDIYFAGRILHDSMQQNKELAERYKSFIDYLKVEMEFFPTGYSRKILLAKTTIFNEYALNQASMAEIESIINHLSLPAKEYMETKIALAKGWIEFQKARPQFSHLCIKTQTHYTPLWVPFRYLLPLPDFFINPEKIPLIFLEPLNVDFSEFLSSLENRPVIFVFETRKSFLSMLQFPAFVKTLNDPKHLLYILEIYPNDQLAIQNRTSFQKLDFQPIFFNEKKRMEAALPVLTEALKVCLTQTDESLKTDSEAGNWLYQIGKRLIFSIKEERLGVNRAPALMELTAQQNWYDPHKGMPAKEKDLGPLPNDNMAVKLSSLSRLSPRPAHSSKKIKLVHIVPQIVDEGHAPSLLLENLIVHHDRDRFEVFVVSTERMQFRLNDYPFNYYISKSSQIRAPKRLELIHALGVPIEIQNGFPFYEFSAQSISAYLNHIKADIALFHGPDAINYMAAQLTDVPMRVLFEHGTPPTYPGFDLAIVSSLEAIEIYKEHYAKIHTDIRALPFQLDVKSKWEPTPYPKDKLGLPNDCKVITTISNHLANRLGNEMCMAIAEILQRIQDSYYVPLGQINEQQKEQFKKFFSAYQVEDRVVFLGNVGNPSQYARSSHIYLNEFPFGSGLGILDAMAAGCPIVSMYDENGPQQARYGGHYFGIDKTITSGKRSDYVALACELLENPAMHKEWSEHAVRQYEKQADVSAYVKKFEAILDDYYHSKIKS